MLRAIGAQIEKTTNKEACRDLSGRRLRDVNAEKRIKNWVQKQAEKEKEAERRKKEKLERLRSEPKVMFEDREYLAEREQIPGKIEDAVSYSLNKKKMAAVAKSTASSAAATVSTSTKDSEPDDSNESSNQASSSTSNDSNEDKGEAIQEVTTGESDVTIHSKEKINLKRKPTMEAKPAKKKKSALWLGDDLSDGDDEDNGDADTEEIIKKQKSLS